MASAALHFAVGLAVGMAAQSVPLHAAWARGKGLTPAIRRWLWVSWLTGTWAIIPSLLRYAGLPDAFYGGWWMNLFLFHPLINQWGPHGTIIGAAAFVAGFAFQYGVILAAILRIRRHSH